MSAVALIPVRMNENTQSSTTPADCAARILSQNLATFRIWAGSSVEGSARMGSRTTFDLAEL